MTRKIFVNNLFLMTVLLLKSEIFCNFLKEDAVPLEECFHVNDEAVGRVFGNYTIHLKKGHKSTAAATGGTNKLKRSFILPTSVPLIQGMSTLNKSYKNVVKSSGVVKSSRSAKSVFLSENCTTVVAQIGTTAVLHCEVSDITENTVSWIRRKDYSLLSVGLITYSADSRFFIQHRGHIKDWSLNIRLVNEMDGGLYECQVPTHPPSHLIFKLIPIEAHAQILGASEKLIHENSTIRLTCIVRNITEYPQYVFWYFQNRMINYDTDGVSVLFSGNKSILSIENASMKRHSGKYTCSPANAQPDTSIIHILQSEIPAAMQSGHSGSIRSQHNSSSFTLLLLLSALKFCL